MDLPHSAAQVACMSDEGGRRRDRSEPDGERQHEAAGLPWLELESFRTSRQLAGLVQRITRQHRRVLPATTDRLRTAASRIGGKLARSSVPVGGPTRRLLDRAKALRAARCVQAELRRLRELTGDADAEVVAAAELADRVIELIRVGS